MVGCRTAAYLLHRAGDDAPRRRRLPALHGVRLACTRLAVTEDAHVEAVQGALHQLADGVEHALLRAVRAEHAVVAEAVLLAVHREGDGGAVGRHARGGCGVRPDTAVHSDLHHKQRPGDKELTQRTLVIPGPLSVIRALHA